MLEQGVDRFNSRMVGITTILPPCREPSQLNVEAWTVGHRTSVGLCRASSADASAGGRPAQNCCVSSPSRGGGPSDPATRHGTAAMAPIYARVAWRKRIAGGLHFRWNVLRDFRSRLPLPKSTTHGRVRGSPPDPEHPRGSPRAGPPPPVPAVARQAPRRRNDSGHRLSKVIPRLRRAGSLRRLLPTLTSPRPDQSCSRRSEARDRMRSNVDRGWPADRAYGLFGARATARIASAAARPAPWAYSRIRASISTRSGGDDSGRAAGPRRRSRTRGGS